MAEFVSSKKLRQDMGLSKSYFCQIVREMKADGRYRIVSDGRITLLRERDFVDYLEARHEGSTT